MAHIEKYTRNGVANLFAHFDRSLSNNSNKDIDVRRTPLNYNLAPVRDIAPTELLQARLGAIKVLKRKDVNVMCSWIVTLPKDFKGNQKQFFQETYNFLESKYGKENVMSAWVHNDEAQPHLHFAFVPVVKDKKKGIEKCSAKELITKVELEHFHADLQQHLESRLQMPVNILNGQTQNGNVTVKKLKYETKLKKRFKEVKEREDAVTEREAKADAKEKKNKETIKQIMTAAEASQKLYSGKTPGEIKSYAEEVAKAFYLLQKKIEKLEKEIAENQKYIDQMKKEIDQQEEENKLMAKMSVSELREYLAKKYQKQQTQKVPKSYDYYSR